MSKMFEISQIGSKPTQIGVESFEPVIQVLVKFSDAVTKGAKANLQKADAIASNALSQSIATLPVKVMGKDYTIEIEWADYGKFVDQGVRGAKDGSRAQGSPFQYRSKMPPRQPIAEWITNKGINPGGTRGNRLKARESLAFLIQRSVFNKGTKRTLFFSDALTPAMQKALIEDVAEALGKTISISMKL
jgi:hypothetical protein